MYDQVFDFTVNTVTVMVSPATKKFSIALLDTTILHDLYLVRPKIKPVIAFIIIIQQFANDYIVWCIMAVCFIFKSTLLPNCQHCYFSLYNRVDGNRVDKHGFLHLCPHHNTAHPPCPTPCIIEKCFTIVFFGYGLFCLATLYATQNHNNRVDKP